MIDMKTIWALMKSMWPHQFKEYGPANGPVFNVWCAELEGADLSAGLAALRTCADDFPPSLPKFKKMCGALVALPKSDEDMRRWAIENGYGDARPREDWKQYRARLEAAVDREQSARFIASDQRRLA